MRTLRLLLRKMVFTFELALCLCFAFSQDVMASDADEEKRLKAQQKACEILQEYSDLEYWLNYQDFIDDRTPEYQLAELKVVAQEITAECSTDYERIYAVAKYVSEEIYYDYKYYYGGSNVLSLSAYDVYTSKKTICDGYERLCRTFLRLLEIPCMKIAGDNHSYNAAYDSENARWIFFDATWMSANVYTINDEWIKEESYSFYFDMTPEYMASLRSHEIYDAGGLGDGQLYYTLNTNEEAWSDTSQWYLELCGVKSPETLKRIESMPEDMAGIPMTTIRAKVFAECEVLETIVIPGFVTQIEDRAFTSCATIKEVDMSQAKITKLVYRMFKDCVSLETVKFPDTLETIDETVFHGCSSLKELDLSRTKVRELPYDFCYDCTALETVKLPDTLDTLGEGAFCGCESLREMDLSRYNIKKIPIYLFAGCVSLESVKLPASVESLDSYAFYDCESLTEMDLSQTVITEVGEAAFMNCTSLESIKLPETVTKIGVNAYSGCSALKRINFPTALTVIDKYAFNECGSLRVCDLSKTQVTEIGIKAFYRADKMDMIILPKTISVIDWHAFSTFTITETVVVTDKTKQELNYEGKVEYDTPWYGREVTVTHGTYTIAFLGNGADSGEMADQICGLNVQSKLDKSAYAKKGYIFSSWNTKPDGTGTGYNDGGKVYNLSETDGGTVTLYAQWQKSSASTEPTDEPTPILPEEPTPEPDVVGQFATYDNYSFYRDEAGDVYCYNADGAAVINEFKCDGTYTYFFQADGTAMRDRLTYHPDGVHVIYFDSKGHEVFSNFANVKKTIAGDEVDDFCFFDVSGYLYVDVVTYDRTGTYLYYANPYGVMDRGKWFEFSDTVKWADGTPFDKAGGRYGYANDDGTLLINCWTWDWQGRYCYMQGNGVALY